MSENPTVALRRLHRWRMALSGLAILIAGITIGAAGAVLVIRPVDRQPPPDVDVAVAGMVGRFRADLNLSSEQLAKIEAILRLRMGNLDQLRQDARPLIDEQLQAMKQEIDAVLSAEQREKWQEITERFDRVFHRGMRPGGRGGPGGPGEGFRGGRGRFRPGDRSDANDLRRSGERRFSRFDPNGLRRRGAPRPDWQRRDFERRLDMSDGVPEPNMENPQFGPADMSPDPNGL